MASLSRLARSTLVFAALASSLLMPAAVLADGEIGDIGDTNSITDLFIGSNTRVGARIDYVHDCPAGSSACSIQVRFLYKCPEFWCSTWTYQTWRAIPLPSGGVSTVYADCNGGQDIDNYWQMEYRLTWTAPTTTTMTITGEGELMEQLSGTVTTKVIAEAAGKVGATGIVKGSYTVQTNTGTHAETNAVVVATSGGSVFHTC